MTSPAGERYDLLVAGVLDDTLTEESLAEAFTPRFLDAVPPVQLLGVLRGLAPLLERPATARAERGTALRVVYGETEALAQVEPHPPHRFEGLLFRPVEAPVDDPRLAEAGWATTGDLGGALSTLQEGYAKLGVPGVVAAAFADHGTTMVWAAAGGFRDLDTGAPAGVGDRLLMGSITKVLTANVALQLVADGSLDLDAPANDHLRRLRVSDDRVTIRHLLTHTGGVGSDFEHYLEHAPEDPSEVLGATVPVDFAPGSARVYSNGGYTVLGEVIAEVTGVPVHEAISARAIEPLGMTSASLSLEWPDDVAPGYHAEDGRLETVPRKVPSAPAAGGLTCTAEDLGRMVSGWTSLLPDELAEAALSRQVERDGIGSQGFGWLIGGDGHTVGHGGGVLGYSSSLLWNRRSGSVSVVVANRDVAVEPLNAHLLAVVDAL